VAALLFCVPLIDELVSGLPVLAMPAIQTDLGLSYVQVGWLFSIATIAGLVVDPTFNAASDFWPKRRLLLAGMGLLAAGMAVGAISRSFTGLLLAFALIGFVNSPTLGIAQAILIDRAPAASRAVMTRWTLTSAIGDLLAPLWVALAGLLQFGWRFLFASAACFWLGGALALLVQPFPSSMTTHEHGGDEGFSLATLRANLMLALRTPLLLRWVVMALLPTAMDEIFLAFSGLLLQDRLGLTPATISLVLGVPIAVGLGTLVALDRLGDRVAPVRLLWGMTWLVVIGLVVLVAAQSLWPAIAGMALVSIGAAGWYPIAKAQAYTLLPGRSGTVRALMGLGAPFEIMLPLLIGGAAELWGIQAGVGLLLFAPVAMLLLLPKNTIQKFTV
jgi:MFS family permease